MKPFNFKQSVLTAGVVTALGLSGTAMAAEQVAGDATSQVTNVATATYSVDGVTQNNVESNAVTVNITESAAFSLIATNNDGPADDGPQENDYNDQLEVVPNGTVVFNHTLKNTGNLEDTYTLQLSQDGSTPSTATDDKDYDFGETTATIQRKNANGESVGSPITVPMDQLLAGTYSITLAPNESADITINAATTNNVGGDTQNLTLSATSEYFTNDGVADNDTLTNKDNSITKLPLFKIVKTVSDTLDLNKPTDTATYKIVVTNEDVPYGTDATDFRVIDALPQGLRIADTPNFSVSGSNGSISAGKEGAGSSTADDSITVTGINLAKGEQVTISFDVQKDEQEDFVDANNVVNHARVEDDLDGDNTPDIVDSTDPSYPNQTTNTLYPAGDDSETIDSPNPEKGGDSTQTLSTSARGLDLVNPTTEEVPTTTTDNTKATHSTVIKNTGSDVEGDKPGEVTFTITDGDVNDNINPQTGAGNPVEVVYDPTPNADGTPNNSGDEMTATLNPNGEGVYDINDAFPNGVQPGGSVTINYDVTTNGATPNDQDKSTVTLIPGGVNPPTPINPTVEDTTKVKGLVLTKTQALDANCDGDVVDAGDIAFTDTDIAAQPGQCVIYKITAFNEFTGPTDFPMDNVVISDTTGRFDNVGTVLTSTTSPAYEVKLADVADASTLPATNQYGATFDSTAKKVEGTVTTLAPQKYAALTFGVQLNSN